MGSIRAAFDKVRPEDLINVIGYLRSRTRDNKLFVHNVKGKFVLTEEKYDVLDSRVVNDLIKYAMSSIEKQIKTDREYGTVYIDPQLKTIPLPKDIKDKSETLAAYPKGSKIEVEKNNNGEPKNMRMFVWWTNAEDRVDIDLSANLYKLSDASYSEKGSLYIEEGKRLTKAGHIGFSGDYHSLGCTHSGNITNGGDAKGLGVTEYIDLDLQQLKSNKIDYVQLFVNVYQGPEV